MDLDFGAVWGGWAPLYSFWGVPGVRSGPSSGSLGLPWPLSALFGRPLGRDARLRVVPPVVYGTSQTVGFRQFGHHLGATILILGCPWCHLGLFLGSLGHHRGSLGLPLALSWCALCAIWTFF